jgi:TatA/E family protein of Tat protein translocase
MKRVYLEGPMNLGFPEILMIFIIALLVFGPKKLPELGKSLGKGLREFKKATDELKSNWDEQLKDVEKSVSEIKDTVHSATRDIENKIKQEVYTPATPAIPAETAESQTPAAHAAATEESKKEVHQA